MYFLYVDESGDTGFKPGLTSFFALSGMVLHELVWHHVLEEIIDFRRFLKDKYGLKLREEIHTSCFMHKPGDLSRIKKSNRLRILRDVLDFEAKLSEINIINIVIEKNGKNLSYDVFQSAWKVLLQRFHNTIMQKNFPGPQNPQDYGIVIVDKTDEARLRQLVRKLRKYNPVPSFYNTSGYRNIHLTTIVEDAIHRDSLHSYFIQLCDVNAYFLYQKQLACGYIKKKGARKNGAFLTEK